MVTKDTRPADLKALEPYKDVVMYKCQMQEGPAVELSFVQMAKEQPTWDVESMIRGTNRLCELAQQGNLLYDVYSPDECQDDPEKADVKLIYMPPKVPSEKPFVVGVAGGAYTCVCSLVESIPTATWLNDLGYPVFIFNYRCMQDPLFPKPLDDLAAAIRFILSHEKDFGLGSREYIVNGYSAGANLTCVWGTEGMGWKKYGLPGPKALFPIYPFISFDVMTDQEMKKWFRGIMFGSQAGEEEAKRYDVPALFTEEYPPCYLVHAKDDPVVPVRNSIWLKELLDEKQIPARLELIEEGGHGWGDGGQTEAKGWPLRAAAFVEGLKD